MVCQKCSVAIDSKTDLFIVCEGSCCRAFHSSCVGLSDASVQCIKKNIIWLCDDCLAVFHDGVQKACFQQPEPDEVPTKVDVELTDIKEKIAYIMESMAAMSDDRRHTPQRAPMHSTPTHLPCLRVGSRVCDSLSLTDHSTIADSDVGANGHGKRKFSLFLTNIDGRVTEEEISELVSRSLSTEKGKVMVKKLIPRWKPYNDLVYASFKVELDNELKLKALREDSWPSGVKYREFIEHPRRTWKPAGWT